jgi:hypothetical protein
MNIFAAILTLFFTLFTVAAAASHEIRPLHSRIPRQLSSKRCKSRPTTAPVPHPTPNYGSTPANNGQIINVKSNCGPIGATKQITSVSGPNGNIYWLNCGLTSGGWKPPHVEISDLIFVPLTTSIKSPSSPFAACKPYISYFEKYGQQLGIPSIILASFAMQESSCNPNTIGGAGEQGLMQITKDKCGGAPGGNCRDPDFNIRTGAHFFANTLRDNGNNVIAAAGLYNGWRRGLTYSQATAAAYTDCCLCQNNLDYLHQLVNGWFQGQDASRVGVYHNLERCRH